MPESSKWEAPKLKMRAVGRVFSLAIYLSRFSHPHFDFDFCFGCTLQQWIMEMRWTIAERPLGHNLQY